MTSPLIPVVKDAPTFTRGGRRECWGATSADGRWRFDRLEDVGTPWEIKYLADPAVRSTFESSLTNARWWVTHHGQQWVEQQQKEAA